MTQADPEPALSAAPKAWAGGAVSTHRGYARTAAAGTSWTTTQAFLNKIATGLSMLIVARTLTPEDVGLASVVLATSGLVMFLPISVMGDVLIAHQHHLSTVIRAARRVILTATIVMVAVFVVSSPLIALQYEKFPFAPMVALLLVGMLWPLSDAVGSIPLARLRTALRYRVIAVISGTTHFTGTCLTMLWALAWPSAGALVVPPMLMMMAKALGFTVTARRMPPLTPVPAERLDARRPGLAHAVTRRIERDFYVASSAQYVHMALTRLPLFITALYVLSADAVGQFGFAFTVAYQAASLITQQLGTVLQPIFGRLKSDPTRQLAGLMRVVATMGAVAVPLSLLQAALAEPIFILLFGERWLPAIPIFIAFSVTQAFYFILAPVMALFKAQGRFGTYFIWQVSQTLASLAIFPFAAAEWGGIGVAWADTALWFISLPIVLWIAARGSGIRPAPFIWSLVAPWIVAGALGIGAFILWRVMPGPRMMAAAIVIFGAGSAALLLALLSVRVMTPGVARDMTPLMSRILRYLPVAGGPLAAWFARTPAPRRDAGGS